MVDWCWCSGWFCFSVLFLIGLHSSSSFVWIEDTLILYQLNFTGSGIIELMYSALPTMVFFFRTMLFRTVTDWNLEVIFSTWF